MSSGVARAAANCPEQRPRQKRRLPAEEGTVADPAVDLANKFERLQGFAQRCPAYSQFLTQLACKRSPFFIGRLAGGKEVFGTPRLIASCERRLVRPLKISAYPAVRLTTK
jgi:hypothetical protein